MVLEIDRFSPPTWVLPAWAGISSPKTGWFAAEVGREIGEPFYKSEGAKAKWIEAAKRAKRDGLYSPKTYTHDIATGLSRLYEYSK